MTDRSGTRIGPFVLEELIGSGGMGVVYRARDIDSADIIAIKLMAPDLASSPSFRDRFIAEAQVSRELDHPNIVPIYGVDEDDDQLYIVMKFVDGPNLKDVISTDPKMEPRRVLNLFEQIGSALDTAHEARLVHRDIKPQNILIGRAGDCEQEQAFLTDFGLVKPTGTESTATRTGQVFGSVQYMSPEQVEGLPTDGRADVYSLGCVLYECLTGEIPFDRPNEVAVLWAHVNEPPPRVTTKRPDLPGGLDEVVAQALAKHPDDRFLTCGELVGALAEGVRKYRRVSVLPAVRPLVRREPRQKTEREVWAPNFFPELSRVRKASEKTNWWRVALVAGALLSMAAAFTEVSYDGGVVGAVGDVADVVEEAATDVRTAAFGDEDLEREIDQDDHARTSLASSSKYEVPIGVGQDPAATDAGQDRSFTEDAELEPAPVVPHGAKIAWTRARPDFGESDIWVMTDHGGTPTRITASEDNEWWPDWSPDGNQIAYIRSGDIWVMDADGRHQRSLSICPDEWCVDPQWSPDGQRIAFMGDSIYVAELDSGTVRVVPGLAASTPAIQEVAGPSWSPDGQRLVGWCSNEGPAPNQQHPGSSNSSPNGICIAPVEGGPRTVVFEDISGWNFDWSRSRDVIAMASAGEIYTFSPDGSDLHAATNTTEKFNVDPSFSSDGLAIVFSPDAPGEIARVNSDGTDWERLTISPDAADLQPDWWGPS